MKKLISVFLLLFVSYLPAQTYQGNVLENSGFDCVTDDCKAKWEVYPSEYSSFDYFKYTILNFKR